MNEKIKNFESKISIKIAGFKLTIKIFKLNSNQ
jgi:hypothetical protein